MDMFLEQKFLPWSIKEPEEPDYLSNITTELKRSIIQHLSVNTLGRLAQVSRFFYGFATPALYGKDVRDEHPHAIFWAASHITTPANKDIVMKVLELAMAYGGNVNQMYHWGEDGVFAPLHLVAARGNTEVAEKLLQLGANPNALGQGLLKDALFSPGDKKLVSRMPTSSITIFSRHSKWRPLFIPFLTEDKKMMQMLLKYGASPVLAVPIEDEMASAVDPGTINILHILSARQREKFTNDASLNIYFRKYARLINVPMTIGLTPLFLSLGCCNEIALKEIMANGGNIEDVNDAGRTPLMQAIICYLKGDNREIYKEIIEYMIESCNAKVGNLGDAGVMETPLICTIKAIPTPLPLVWKHAIRDIKGIIDLLLKHGADLNEISNAGFTLLHVLCDIICKTDHTGWLIELFNRLVGDGADLNILSYTTQSVLGTCMIKYERQPTKFYSLLLKLGASLAPQEVDAAFVEWAKDPGCRRSFNPIQCKDHITQASIDFAYEIALYRDAKLFEILKEHFPTTTIAERVASDALLTWETRPKPFELALELDWFNGCYIHSNGNSLLHSIVARLGRCPKYKDAHARDDAWEMLYRGASLEHRDSRGKTPLQKLRDLLPRRNCPILRLFLLDVEIGLGVIGKEPTEEVAQEKWRAKWKKVLDDAVECGMDHSRGR